ncbi:hypothetical protein GOP47_0000519 [Adiantum capillus-veneris]|uniref:DUF4097 domain-containing protein n=1 Tax=Adiantum capillus-veneris TaxID=13818 RepID=A0A9D4VE40_ADICA|nr:hypothetical protein GOP47_0000519 [Adiantum capillus-veneris]
MNVLSRARVPWALIKPQRHSFTYCTAAPPYYNYLKLDVQVGATLQLNLAPVNAEVDIYTGDNMEQIEVKSLWKKVGSFSNAFTPITQQNNCICVDLQTTEAEQFLQRLEAVMPGRWCNLFLRSGKGHVTIQNMKEANVNIVTNGGNLTFGEVRGNEAFIETNGGSVTAALITAALELRTSGGILSVDKAIGTALQIVSEGGDMKIGSAYGQDVNISSGGGCISIKHLQAQEMARELQWGTFMLSIYEAWRWKESQLWYINDSPDVNISSGGGCISIKHLQAQEMARVSSDGGHVQIDGLDGNAAISTNGGNLQLQLLANAKEVKINAGAGEVTLFMPSEDHSKIEQVQEEEESFAGDPTNLSEKSSVTQGSKEDPSSCRVCILGSGKLTTIRRSCINKGKITEVRPLKG